MNFPALFLALILSAATLFGQEAASNAPENGVLVAQAPASAPAKDTAVTAINDRGAKDKPAPPAPAGDTASDPTAHSAQRPRAIHTRPPMAASIR